MVSFLLPNTYCILILSKENMLEEIGGGNMKGYVIDSGYMGFVDGEYVLFADEQDYREMFEEI